jgi:hypothetical protein
MTTREAILARVSAYIARHGISESRFGTLVARDHKLVPRLRTESVTLERIERAEQFMADYADRLPDEAQVALPASADAA